jgi:ABC-type Mn2+/Zn2+ transport system ATPase subunit
MTADAPILRVTSLSVQYDETYALRDVSFDVPPGDCLAIIGPNGAGKSTLMKAIMGLLTPARESRIEADPQLLGYVPQHHDVDWTFPVTVRDVVMMGLTRRIGWFRWPGNSHQQQVQTALERVDLAAYADRQIGDLSGGQRQRVFMARALAQQAAVLLLDEPFAGVDVAAQEGLMDVINRLNDDHNLTILLSTHDLGLAFKRFRRVMALNRRLIAIGPAQDLYTPDVLSELYGGAIATMQDGDRVMVFVDEHAHGHAHETEEHSS